MATAKTDAAPAKKRTVKRSPPGPKQLFITYRLNDSGTDIEDVKIERDAAAVLKLMESEGNEYKYKTALLHPAGGGRTKSESDESDDD